MEKIQENTMERNKEIKKELTKIIQKHIDIKEALIDHFTPSEFLELTISPDPKENIEIPK